MIYCKKNVCIAFFLLVVLVFGLLVSMPKSYAANQVDDKKSILIVYFDNGQEDMQNGIVKTTITEQFPDWMVEEVSLHYGSADASVVEEKLKQLEREGYQEVVLQPICLSEIKEYQMCEQLVQEYQKQKIFAKLEIGKPLLSTIVKDGTNEDYLAVIFAIEGKFARLQCCNGVLFIGNHIDHEIYEALQDRIEQIGFKNMYFYTLQEMNDPAVYKKMRLKRFKKLTVAPFSLYLSDKENQHDISVKQLHELTETMKKNGSRGEPLEEGLLENSNIRQIYVNHINEAMREEKKETVKNNTAIETQTISQEDARKRYKEQSAIFIDVRTKEEYEDEHIEGALSIPLAELPNRLAQVPRSKTVILVCTMGKRSAMADRILKEHQFSNTCSLDGGMEEWNSKK